MEGISDHSAVDISVNPISDAEGFLLPAPPFVFEQWTSPCTPNNPGPADSPKPQVGVEVGSLISCGATALHLLTQIFRRSPFVNTACS